VAAPTIAVPAVGTAAYYRIPRRLVHGIALALFVVVFAGVVGVGVWLRTLGEFLVVPENLPTHADAIVVLGGGGNRGNREQQAADLFRRGLAPIVITTGGPVAGEVARATYAEWSLQRLVRRGVPANAAFATNEGDSTATDALGVRRVADARGWHDLLLVTDSWHTRRTKLIFDQVFRGTGVRLYASPAPNEHYVADAWWTDEEGAISLTSEYIKLAAYVVDARALMDLLGVATSRSTQASG
jgi:uncharacterized SAM-binding protein YcdF (DUF218 family)